MYRGYQKVVFNVSFCLFVVLPLLLVIMSVLPCFAGFAPAVYRATKEHYGCPVPVHPITKQVGRDVAFLS